MLERSVEAGLRRKVEKRGGLCLKFTSPGCSGVPDRILITGDGRVVFVELKQTKGRLSAIQEYQIARMRAAGCDVRVVHGRKEVDAMLEDIYGVQAT